MQIGMQQFLGSAKALSRNPLGIISLFIVLVYGCTCLLFCTSCEHLGEKERQHLIWFIVLFPVLVLGIFVWLVSRHHNKLYAPTDFRDDRSFLIALQHPYEDKKNKEIDKIKAEIEEKSKKSSNALDFLQNEYISALKVIFALNYYVKPDLRQAALEGIPDSATKTNISKSIDTVSYYENDIMNALSGKKGLLSALGATDPANKAAPVDSSVSKQT